MMKAKQFEKGKTYFSMTRNGNVRFFKVTDILRRKSTGERVFVVGSYDEKSERRYEIHNTNGNEWIYVDNRLATVVDATEWTPKRIEK